MLFSQIFVMFRLMFRLWSLIKSQCDHCSDFRATYDQNIVQFCPLTRPYCDHCPDFCATYDQTVVRLCSLIRPLCDHCSDHCATRTSPRPCILGRTAPPMCDPISLNRVVLGRAHKPGN